MNEERRITDPFKDDLHILMTHVGDIKITLGKIEEKLLKVDDHHKTLYGINGLPGLTITVDRLDQSEKTRNGHIAILWTAIVGILAKVGWDIVTKKP